MHVPPFLLNYIYLIFKIFQSTTLHPIDKRIMVILTNIASTKVWWGWNYHSKKLYTVILNMCSYTGHLVYNVGTR